MWDRMRLIGYGLAFGLFLTMCGGLATFVLWPRAPRATSYKGWETKPTETTADDMAALKDHADRNGYDPSSLEIKSGGRFKVDENLRIFLLIVRQKDSPDYIEFLATYDGSKMHWSRTYGY